MTRCHIQEDSAKGIWPENDYNILYVEIAYLALGILIMSSREKSTTESYDFLLVTTYVRVIVLCARATIIVLLVHWLVFFLEIPWHAVAVVTACLVFIGLIDTSRGLSLLSPSAAAGSWVIGPIIGNEHYTLVRLLNWPCSSRRKGGRYPRWKRSWGRGEVKGG